MQEADLARRRASEAVEDIHPPRLREAITDRIRPGSMIPGVLVLLSAAVVDGSPDAADVERRAAGVQLIYEGLHITRSLVHDDPWTADSPPDKPADLDVLAADVLVARGFRLLARTDAADDAVETVRAFGREQTDTAADSHPDPPARTLEANVFELAAVAGATAAGGDTPLALRQYVVGLARNLGDPPLPPAVDGLPETIEEVLGRVSADPTPDEPVRPSGVTDP
jgi:hypothetical protein